MRLHGKATTMRNNLHCSLEQYGLEIHLKHLLKNLMLPSSLHLLEALLPKALQHVDKGGIVVCGGIHMSDIPSFPYHILWEERSICSVANLTREDGEEFLKIVSETAINTNTTNYPLNRANEAVSDLEW